MSQRPITQYEALTVIQILDVLWRLKQPVTRETLLSYIKLRGCDHHLHWALQFLLEREAVGQYGDRYYVIERLPALPPAL